MHTPTRYQLQLAEANTERGSLILNRLVPAPDHGRGFRRDPDTGFVYYSSEWLSDSPIALEPARMCECGCGMPASFGTYRQGHESDPKPSQ